MLAGKDGSGRKIGEGNTLIAKVEQQISFTIQGDPAIAPHQHRFLRILAEAEAAFRGRTEQGRQRE